MAYPTRKTHPHLVDACEPYEFTVTIGDIKGAVCGDKERCAGARAIKRDPNVKDAHLCRTAIVIEYNDDSVVRYMSPKKLTDSIDRFDNQTYDENLGIFPAGKYKLRAPSPSQQLGAQRAPRNTDPSKPKKPRKRSSIALR